LPHSSQKFIFVRSHCFTSALIADIFVRGCTEHHLRKNWRQVDAFPGEQVNYLAVVGWVGFVVMIS